MKLEKCPVCTAKMKEQNGRMICPQCGYYQIIDTSNPAPLSGQPTIPGQTGSPYPSSAQSQTGSGQTGSFNRPTGQPTGAGQTGSFNRPTGQQARPQTGPAPTVYPQRNITVSARRGGGGVSWRAGTDSVLLPEAGDAGNYGKYPFRSSDCVWLTGRAARLYPKQLKLLYRSGRESDLYGAAAANHGDGRL